MATNLDLGIFSFWSKVSHWHMFLVHESLNNSDDGFDGLCSNVPEPPIAIRSKPTLTNA